MFITPAGSAEESIANRGRDAEHRIAQSRGRSEWYSEFVTRVAKVERHNRFLATRKSDDALVP